jgi:hypothetical protein
MKGVEDNSVTKYCGVTPEIIGQLALNLNASSVHSYKGTYIRRASANRNGQTGTANCFVLRIAKYIAYPH